MGRSIPPMRVDKEMRDLLSDIAKRDGITRVTASKVVARKVKEIPFAGFDLVVTKPKIEKKRKRDFRIL